MVRKIIAILFFISLSPISYASVQSDLMTYLERYDTSFSKQETNQFKQYAKDYGLVIFYEANQKASQDMADILETYHESYGFVVIGIAVNSAFINSLLINRLDQGQALHFGIIKTPTIVMVNPKTAKEVIVQTGGSSETQFRENLNKAFEKMHFTDEVKKIKQASPFIKPTRDHEK